MNEPAQVVRDFLSLLADGEAESAIALLSRDIEWRNTGMPTYTGGKVRAMLRDMERKVGFGVTIHHLAADGPIVLTDRTDVLRKGRFETKFWVCGTFEVRDGVIVLWDDHFSMGNLLVSSLKGGLRALLPG